MQPPLEDTQKIEFTAAYSGTVTWANGSATPHSAKLNGPAVALDMAVGTSATFEIPKTDGVLFPALELTFNGIAVAPYFTLDSSPASPWSAEKPDVFTCKNSSGSGTLGIVSFCLDKDGILIVGTVDMGGEHDK